MKLFAVFNEILRDFRTFLNEFLNYCRIFKFTFFLGRFSFGFFSFLITRQLQKLCQVFSFFFTPEKGGQRIRKRQNERRWSRQQRERPGEACLLQLLTPVSSLSVSLFFSLSRCSFLCFSRLPLAVRSY